jgi:hypothetical protein
VFLSGDRSIDTNPECRAEQDNATFPRSLHMSYNSYRRASYIPMYMQ